MRSFLVLALALACDPKGGAGSATAATTTGDATSSGSTADATTADAMTSGATTSGTSTGGSSTTAASTGDGPPPLCTCDGGDCGLSPVLCDTIEAHCDGHCDQSFWAGVDNEAALQCALLALRDRTPGDIGWLAGIVSDGPDTEQSTLRILADGTVLRYPSFTTIFGSACGPDTHDTLKPPDYFSGCLAMPDPADRFLCMVKATDAELAECAPFQEC